MNYGNRNSKNKKQYHDHKENKQESPTKNRVFCAIIRRLKFCFETEKKALNFIKFNAGAIAEKSGYAPVRAYYCKACGGYHVTHVPLEEASCCTAIRAGLADL